LPFSVSYGTIILFLVVACYFLFNFFFGLQHVANFYFNTWILRPSFFSSSEILLCWAVRVTWFELNKTKCICLLFYVCYRTYHDYSAYQIHNCFWECSPNVRNDILEWLPSCLEHFFWNFVNCSRAKFITLKCLQTCLRTFWMFRNILKSSNGTFWNVSKQILQEHFKMFKTFLWTFLAIFIQNIVSCFQIFFHLTLRNVYKLVRKLFLNVQEHFEKF